MSLSRAINKLSLIIEFIIDIIDKSMPFSSAHHFCNKDTII